MTNVPAVEFDGVKLHIFATVHNFAQFLLEWERAMIKLVARYRSHTVRSGILGINVRVPFWVKLVQDNGSNVHLILFRAKRIGNDSSAAYKKFINFYSIS